MVCKNTKMLALVVSLFLVPVLLSGCGGKDEGSGGGRAGRSAKGKASSEAAIIPGANLVVSMDLAAARNSAMYQKIKALQEEDAADAVPGAEAVEEIEEMAEMAKEILGLKEDDLVRVTFSGKLLGDSLDGVQEDIDENVEAAIGIELKTAVELDQIEKFLNAAAEKDGKTMNITRETVGGANALVVDEGDGDDPMYVATVSKGKIVLGGTRDGLANAVKRAAKPVKMASAMEGSGMPSGTAPQMFLAIILSDAMKAEIGEKITTAEAEEGMAANFAKCFKGMNGATLGIGMTDAVDLAVYVNLASEEQATTLKSLFENTALSGLKMGVTMMTGGQPMPMLESITTQVTGPVASLNLKVTEADIDLIKAAAEKSAQSMQPPAPPQ